MNRSNREADLAQRYHDLLRRAQAVDHVLGLILARSRGAGVFVTDRSDFDAYVIVGSADRDWGISHGALVEVWPMTVDEFRRHAMTDAPDAWNRPTFLYVRVELDKLDGEIGRIVEQKRRLAPHEVGRIVPAVLDDYINSLYRSLKNLEAGRELEGRLDAGESLSPLLTVAFALEGRVRPFNKYLRHELEARPLRTVTIGAIERVAREAAPQDQRSVFRHLENRAREAGFDSIIDRWEPDVLWLRGAERRIK